MKTLVKILTGTITIMAINASGTHLAAAADHDAHAAGLMGKAHQHKGAGDTHDANAHAHKMKGADIAKKIAAEKVKKADLEKQAKMLEAKAHDHDVVIHNLEQEEKNADKNAHHEHHKGKTERAKSQKLKADASAHTQAGHAQRAAHHRIHSA